VRTALIILVVAAAAFAVALTPRSPRRVLDPHEPIAADGSMIAGRAATIYDTNPLYGAFKQPLPGSDDPQDVEADLKHAQWTAQYDRGPITRNMRAPLDWSRCKKAARAHLVGVVRIYYLIRGGEISRFAARGPRAKAAIEAVWSTPDDRQIDNFVRHALQYGILHKTDFPEHTYPEFARMFADVQELGAGCTSADN
jgi:hypothetical protein